MRRSVSISGPKAFSMRNAISPESAARAFSRLDRVTRETWSARAASVTDIPSGSMTSVRMKSPGWTGFFIRLSVVAFIVHLDDLFLLHTKCQTPVACDVKAPGIFAFPNQLDGETRDGDLNSRYVWREIMGFEVSVPHSVPHSRPSFSTQQHCKLWLHFAPL